MKAVRKRNESSVLDQIGEDLLTWVSWLLLALSSEKVKLAAKCQGELEITAGQMRRLVLSQKNCRRGVIIVGNCVRISRLF